MPADTLPGPPSAAQRQVVRREVLTGVIGNVVIAVVVTWLLFRGRPDIPVLGRSGAVFGIVPGTFMFTLGMTIGLTLGVRRRVRRSEVARLIPGQGPPGLAWLPRNVILRGLLLAVLAEALLVPLTLALLAAFAPSSWQFAGALAFNAAYFAVLSALVVPVVAWRALADSD